MKTYHVVIRWTGRALALGPGVEGLICGSAAIAERTAAQDDGAYVPVEARDWRAAVEYALVSTLAAQVDRESSSGRCLARRADGRRCRDRYGHRGNHDFD